MFSYNYVLQLQSCFYHLIQRLSTKCLSLPGWSAVWVPLSSISRVLSVPVSVLFVGLLCGLFSFSLSCPCWCCWCWPSSTPHCVIFFSGNFCSLSDGAVFVIFCRLQIAFSFWVFYDNGLCLQNNFPSFLFLLSNLKAGKGKIMSFIAMFVLLVRSTLFIIVYFFLFCFVLLSYLPYFILHLIFVGEYMMV